MTRRKKPTIKYPRNLFDVCLNTFYIERLGLFVFGASGKSLNHKGANPETGEMKTASPILGLPFNIYLWSNQATPLKMLEVLEPLCENS